MRRDKDLAIKLRRKNKSYNEINRLLGVPKGTLAGWFQYDFLSQKTKELLTKRALEKSRKQIHALAAANKARWEKWRAEARNEAVNEFKELSGDSLFIAGMMLYWAEGDSKVKNPVRLTNTDPRLIALYIEFLNRILRLPKEKLRITMILYPDLLENECFRFWSRVTDLPENQFYKTQYIKGKHPTIRLSKGICSVTLSSRRLKEKFMVWIDLLSKELYNNAMNADVV